MTRNPNSGAGKTGRRFIAGGLYPAIGVICLLVLWNCTMAGPEGPGTNKISILSWNVQALFDGIDTDLEYREYTSGAGWNNEKYQARLYGIAGAVKGIAEARGLTFDVLALIEVENSGVLGDLAEHFGMDYKWQFFAGAPGGATGIGILSRFPIAETLVHSAHFDAHGIPRPVAEVWIDYGGEPLVLMACHWKSKTGGARETEPLRQAEAGIIARRLDEISAANPETPVIVLGDLNENYDDFVRTGAAYPCALMPDSEDAAAALGLSSVHPRPGFQNFLVLSPQNPPRAEYIPKVREAAVLYSPWEDPAWKEGLCESPGSYYYDGGWETIDHFLLNAALFNKRGWEYGGFSVLPEAPFTGAGGAPHAYNPRTGTGLSDHLPIMLNLVMEKYTP